MQLFGIPLSDAPPRVALKGGRVDLGRMQSRAVLYALGTAAFTVSYTLVDGVGARLAGTRPVLRCGCSLAMAWEWRIAVARESRHSSPSRTQRRRRPRPRGRVRHLHHEDSLDAAVCLEPSSLRN